MDFKERKKDIEEKLKYIGYPEREIPFLMRTNYNFISRFFGLCSDFEDQVNSSYKTIKKENDRYDKVKKWANESRIYLMNDKRKFPKIVYN